MCDLIVITTAASFLVGMQVGKVYLLWGNEQLVPVWVLQLLGSVLFASDRRLAWDATIILAHLLLWNGGHTAGAMQLAALHSHQVLKYSRNFE